MTDVFLSYARASQEKADSLAQDLGGLGYQVWFDQELTGGQSWWDQVLSRIRACDVFLLALAPESLESQACKLEYGYASQLGKNILPVLVADNVSMDLLPPALAQIHYTDYRAQDKRSVFTLLKAINALPPSAPLPEPLPPPPPVPLSYLGTLGEQINSSSALSFQEQTVLLVRLRQGLREKRDAASVMLLLRQFRARDDLFARVADELDELASDAMDRVGQAPAPSTFAGAARTYRETTPDSSHAKNSKVPSGVGKDELRPQSSATVSGEQQHTKIASAPAADLPEQVSFFVETFFVIAGLLFGVAIPMAVLESLNYSLRTFPMVAFLSVGCGLVPVAGCQLWRLRRAGCNRFASLWLKFVPAAWIVGVIIGMVGLGGSLVVGPTLAALVGMLLAFRVRSS